jgi:hypothetical protein
MYVAVTRHNNQCLLSFLYYYIEALTSSQPQDNFPYLKSKLSATTLIITCTDSPTLREALTKRFYSNENALHLIELLCASVITKNAVWPS